VGKIKNTEAQNRANTAMKSPGESTPFLFYIITPKMERQYLTVDSSMRQDKSG
jgi:hypothetical protein